jgi:hypothetical protein
MVDAGWHGCRPAIKGRIVGTKKPSQVNRRSNAADSACGREMAAATTVFLQELDCADADRDGDESKESTRLRDDFAD